MRNTAPPHNVLPGLETVPSTKNKRTKIQNYLDAMDTCEEGRTIELFRMADRPGEFIRLDVDIRKLQHLASNSDVFGTQAEWGDIPTHRYDKLQPNETHKAHTTSTSDPVVIKEVFDIVGLRSYTPHCGENREGACESLLNCAIPITGGGGRRIRGNPSSVFEHDSVWAKVRTGRALSKNLEGWGKCGLPKTRSGRGYL